VSLTARLSIRRDRNQFWQKLRGLHAAALAQLRSWNIAEQPFMQARTLLRRANEKSRCELSQRTFSTMRRC
jgi:hypothetical protein